ncbi:MAG: GAF domain-containing protein [Flavobacteriaceae bacterium]|nr:GAF domain-containing protein [Flavobacteriaceae bacterium]
MEDTGREFPLDIKISFKTLFDTYEANLNSGSNLQKKRAQEVLEVAKKYPLLSEGFTSEKDIKKLRKQIDFVLEDIFPSVLQTNEIKIAGAPFQSTPFKTTARYDAIKANADSSYKMELIDMNDEEFYILGCSLILRSYYGYNIDFRRPYYYSIPDAHGVIKWYRVLYNADFGQIEKTGASIDITQNDVSQLLDNFNNIELWKEKFPPNSWSYSGFVIANMYDATADVSISNFKTTLLAGEQDNGKNFVEEFEEILKSLYSIQDLRVGFTIFNKEEDILENPGPVVDSFILNKKKKEKCNTALCEASFYTLFKQKQFYCISEVERYAALYPENVLYKKLLKQQVKSAIIVPVVERDEIYGILEIVSTIPQALNTINANKLHDILPNLVDSVKRSKEKEENEIELMIQDECTAIHSSVHWKFHREAARVLKAQNTGQQAYFREIVFENVYPLYGQIDIKGSSEARNDATKKDLILQLEFVQKIINRINAIENLPIYEQIAFEIESFLEDFESDELQVNSERQVLQFLRHEIVPLFKHLSKKNDTLKEMVEEYEEMVESSSGLVYLNRKGYDESVTLINKKMAAIIDRKQKEAQEMYPHYFERFKTDGVEHNLYIGEAITKTKNFHKVYLYNLRLWQLQVMCEMENSFYKLKENLPVKLDAASMILAFNSPLSLRFRMDEKRFDVDGTYNARYEVVKKRVDKANIKDTEERITQSGKLSIIYSQKEDEVEYLKYISFLQHKKLLDKDVELLEVEDLQGVTGLKAIRVSVLYETNNKNDQKEYYTYNDLMSQITN